MWRRNGFSLINQIYFYHNVRCRQEMLDRDVMLLQIAATLIDSNEFLVHILNRFNLMNWAREDYEVNYYKVVFSWIWRHCLFYFFILVGTDCLLQLQVVFCFQCFLHFLLVGTDFLLQLQIVFCFYCFFKWKWHVHLNLIHVWVYYIHVNLHFNGIYQSCLFHKTQVSKTWH